MWTSKRFSGRKICWLVVEPTHLEKICSAKWESSPNRAENKKYFKPPPSTDIAECMEMSKE